MTHAIWPRPVAATLIALVLPAGCSPIALPNLMEPAAAHYSSGTGSTLYAFSPGKPLVASYARDASNVAKATSVLKGSKTQLSTGNGMAVDTNGTIYALIQAPDASGTAMKLLVFPPEAKGNVAPERTAWLKGPLVPGNAVGFVLDGHGNFWLAAIGKLLRYSTSAHGSARPNASISVQLTTPDGLMAAHSSNVALDSMGNIYCACDVVYRGNQAIGVSEYALVTSRKARLVRSFYDFTLPEAPPSTIAIDRAGTIYLASSLPNSGVYAYGPRTKSGKAHYARRFAGRAETMISSIATDFSGDVYVAAGSRIMVFAPKANGHTRPIRSIKDPRHLDYTDNDYGTLLNVH